MQRVVVALLALVAGAVSLAASAASQPPVPSSGPIAPLPIDALSAPASVTMPVISPDGRRIAARITEGGRNWIAVYDLAAAEQPPQLTEEKDFSINWLRWANAEQLLIGIEVVQSIYGIEIPVTRLIMLNVRTRAFSVIDTGHGLVGDRVLHVDPAGRSILVAADSLALDPPRVIRVDLATGATTTVQRARTGVWNWFVDGAGVVRAGVEYTSDRTRLHYRPTAGAELRTLTLARGEDGGVVDDIGFATAGDGGVIVTDSVTGRFAAYAFDFATGSRGNVIFEHATADVTSLVVGDDGQLAAVTYEDERPRTHWVQPELRAIQATIDGALPGKTNVILNRSAGSAKILLWSGAANDPGRYYVFDRAARRIEGFAAPYDALLDRQFAEVRPISYRSRDGLTIPGYLTLPPGRPERGLPLILLPHGGPFARDSWNFNPEVQLLASRGYAVLQPNFRGSTGYGRAHVEQGFGQLGSGMINDMEDGVAWLVDQGIVDPGRVCIMGSSYGGYAAMWAAARAARPYRCAISFAGVSDLRSMLRYNRRQFIPRRYIRDWQQRIRGEERMDLSTISPLEHAARLRVPVLIAHGTRDRTVPPSQSASIVRALTRAGAQVESKVYPEAGHGFSRPEDAADFYRRVEAFLARHNPADPPPITGP